MARRTKSIKFFVNNDEYKALKKKQVGSQLASWVRDVCLAERNARTRKLPVVDPTLLRQLAGIGNNINQLARLANSQSKSFAKVDSVSIIMQLALINERLKIIEKKHSVS